jgi:CheY-like chemotaxis protein
MTKNKPPALSGQVGYSADMPDAFAAQVRESLAHLYDLPWLQSLALVQERAEKQARPLYSTALAFKQELMDLLEMLNPGRDFYFRAPEARSYNILLLHYVERQTVQKAADELGISERQAYRELRQAETDLARLLWLRQQEAATPANVRERLAQQPVDPAAGPAAIVDLQELLASAIDVVRSLASVSAVTVGATIPEGAKALVTNLPLARQVMIRLLSQAVQSAAGTVAISVVDEGAQLALVLEYVLRLPSPEREVQSDSMLQPMVDQLGWRVRWHSAGGVTLSLPKPMQQKNILCIDDDPNFSELLRRSLTGYAVQVLSAASGQLGLEQAVQSLPDLIVLDVMMAGLDGWETLQRLRTHVATQQLPVVVCSVFNDPQLAHSLGATAMLPKPLDPALFLRTLEELEVI